MLEGVLSALPVNASSIKTDEDQSPDCLAGKRLVREPL
jgi:hypothetical protein